ncbi:MAG: type II secretion system protein GspN [Deltaproteobacteria bacterium]
MKSPRRSISFAGLRDALGRHRLAIGYTCFTLAVFVVGVVATLPHEKIARQLIERATRSSAVGIEFRELSLRPLLGYTVRDLQILPEGKDGPTIHIDSLDAAPVLTSLLLPGAPAAIDLEARLWGGVLEARLAGDPRGFLLALEGENLELAEATRGLFPGGGALLGTARIALDLEGDPRGRELVGALSLDAAAVGLRDLLAAGFKVPNLTFESVQLRARLDGKRLEISEFSARGAELTLRATGRIQLAQPLESSILDIRFELQIHADAPAGLRALPLLLPKRTQGDAFYKLKGTLRRPKLS